MANLLINDIQNAAYEAKRIDAVCGDIKELPFINASTVIGEFQSRCANGMQYTTFPNRITDLELGKLTAKGYIVTKNTVPSADRYGAPDLYIGFQVALNAVAAEQAMQVTPNE